MRMILGLGVVPPCNLTIMQGTSAVRRYRNVCMHVCNVMLPNVMQGKVSYVELCMYVCKYVL